MNSRNHTDLVSERVQRDLLNDLRAHVAQHARPNRRHWWQRIWGQPTSRQTNGQFAQSA